MDEYTQTGVHLLPLSSLSLWDENYRSGDIPAIITSIREFGFNSSLRVWHDRVVVAGNQSLRALRTMNDAGAPAPFGVPVGESGEWLIRTIDVTHLSAAKAKAFAIADNRTQELGVTDDERLALLLKQIGEEDPDAAAATGYDEDALAELLARVAEDAERGPEPEHKGSLLELATVTIGEPSAQCQLGQVWKLGPHHLVVGRIFTDWPVYVPLLTEGSLFVPLPNPVVVFSERYDSTPLVMVQPNPYAAGHLIDRHRERYGVDAASLLASPEVKA